MKRSILVGSLTACIGLGASASLMAAENQPAGTRANPVPSLVATNTSGGKPAATCLADLRNFDGQMEKSGYWLGGSGYGLGYPMGGYGYGYPVGGYAAGGTYLNARPGYQVRMLLASANILARRGQQQQCEEILTTARALYTEYESARASGKTPPVDLQGWRNMQIAAAQPVVSTDNSFRSDQLLGTDVRDPQGQALGSVDDIVMSPKTGKIAYLVLARGGIFGFDEKYVPVPWQDFKMAPNGSLLVLDTTKTSMDGAPRVSEDQFSTSGQYEQESQKVDAYWTAHLPKRAGK